MEQPKYKRVLIKISGEALGGEKGMGFDELGEKGVYIGEISKGGNNLEFLPTARRMCLFEKINITDCDTEILVWICPDMVFENFFLNASLIGWPKQEHAENLCKIELIGTANIIPAEVLSRLGSLYYAKLRDKTEPPINYEELSHEISLKGLFVKNMLSRLNAADGEEKENLKEALKLGLKAFDGEVSCDEN